MVIFLVIQIGIVAISAFATCPFIVFDYFDPPNLAGFLLACTRITLRVKNIFLKIEKLINLMNPNFM